MDTASCSKTMQHSRFQPRGCAPLRLRWLTWEWGRVCDFGDRTGADDRARRRHRTRRDETAGSGSGAGGAARRGARAGWVAAGTHVTAMGADFTGKDELDPALFARADRVVADDAAIASAAVDAFRSSRH